VLFCVAAALCGGRLFQRGRLDAIQYVFPCGASGTIEVPTADHTLLTVRTGCGPVSRKVSRSELWAEVPCTRYNR